MDKHSDKRPAVLIVDDEPHIVMAIRFLMDQQGFDTRTASDGQEALHVLRDFRPDLMILDVMMPNKTGFEVATEVRQQEAFADLQILFLTARGSDRDKRTGYGAGGDLYLTKPFDNQELVEKVCDILEVEVKTPNE